MDSLGKANYRFVGYAYTHRKPHTDLYIIADPDANGNRYSYTHSHTLADPKANCDPYTNAVAYRYAYLYPYPAAHT